MIASEDWKAGRASRSRDRGNWDRFPSDDCTVYRTGQDSRWQSGHRAFRRWRDPPDVSMQRVLVEV